MTPHSLVRWDADAIAGWAREAPAPADDPNAYVVLRGPVVAGHGAVEIIPTWAAETPPGTWVEVQLRAWRGEAWEALFRVAVWDSAPAVSRRTSFDAQRCPAGRLATDTVVLAEPADAVQARVLLCAEPGAEMPELVSLALCLTADEDGSATVAHRNGRPPAPSSAHSPQPSALSPRPSALGPQPSALSPQPSALSPQPSALGAQPSALRLPLLVSQYLSYPEHGPLWCSPTALLMALAYWHERTGLHRLAPFRATESVPATVAPMVYDPGWEGTGNWAFNTAFAASLGLRAYVSRMHSLAQLARWTDAGVPVPISIRWEPGELDGAAGRSSGHITVVTGFAGDRVLMAEPAARDSATIARTYRADQLLACWQRASSGVAYLIHPHGWPTPRPSDGDAWV